MMQWVTDQNAPSAGFLLLALAYCPKFPSPLLDVEEDISHDAF